MAMQLPEGAFNITNGPSKFDLMCSVFDGKTVKISCDIWSGKISPRLNVRFQFAGAEDGSYELWVGSVRFIDENYETETRKFYYNCKNRTGRIHERVLSNTTSDAQRVINKM